MQRFLLAACLGAVLPMPGHPQDDPAGLFPRTGEPGTLADTARIDHMLDSVKAWVGTGETERSAALAREVLAAIEAVSTGSRPGAPLDLRALQAHKYEGIAHHYAGRYAAALKSFQAMQQVAERLGRDKDVAAALNYQGYQYRAMDDLQRAKDMTLRALAILRTMPESIDLPNAISGLASIYFNLNIQDSALLFQREALALYQRIGHDTYAAMTRQDIAEIHMSEERYDSALHYLRLAGQVLREEPNLSLRCIFLGQLGRALVGLGRYEEARSVLMEAERIAEEMDNDEYLSRVYEMLALVASASGNPLAAIHYQHRTREAVIRDLDLAKAQELTEVRLQAEHEKVAALAREQIAEQRRQKRNALIGTVLVLVIALLLFRSYRMSRRAARALQVKNEELVRAQQELVRSEKQREAEQVRTRIARDIHDEIGGELTRIRLLGDEARHLLMEDREQASEAIGRMARSAQEANASLRDIVWSTDPGHDSLKSLIDHVRDIAGRMLQSSGAQADVRLGHEGPDMPVDPAWKSHVLRILKEAMNNAVKYAGARTIEVTFASGPEGILLRVADDGAGFDPQAASDGNGLRNMRARAGRIGAEFSVTTAPGRGCRIEVRGPVPAAA